MQSLTHNGHVELWQASAEFGRQAKVATAAIRQWVQKGPSRSSVTGVFDIGTRSRKQLTISQAKVPNKATWLENGIWRWPDRLDVPALADLADFLAALG